uniref:AAA+ ATPase domain-containing protein n=1 Tax=Aegilops tauschii subsp. strangulata TaxID=200361 RepID=A0A453GYE9_AEGTS|nr:putative disease resistance protein At3g14460 [Aegilops tauschii subsp. strangulata]XP_020176209.1 putative disease resistance protein At3g14460 [Aegilops tauschii subsp. strangulata]XP_040242320.1 putative disease resistance protein At3g14460 [Aegilops tauschii subsp. strangulata]XP_045083228.1 putative disease resistance protein At3g14460 [Aegilops tauschii subsp. strangulata]XP_045083229.1 putative disease resistance protein At3g14460 [Aegilops tauschii subsp. strangulata]XP_045083230.1 
MEVAVSAARWVVTKALAPVTDGLLEAWAASAGLGPNIDALKMQLLYAQGMLNNAPGQGRDITNPALKGLLHKLRQLAYVADDALDELDYFRIQDALEGTYHAAAGVDDLGCLQALALNARHTARYVAGKIKSMSSCSRAASPLDAQEDIGGSRGCSCAGGCSMPKVASGAVQAAVGKHFPCCYSSPHTSELVESSNVPAASKWWLLCGACPPKAPTQRVGTTEETPKLKFDRVEMSKRMIDIVEQLKHVCAMVSTILNLELLSLSRIPNPDVISKDRPKTTPQIIEPQLYGRDAQKKKIVDGITRGEYSSEQLTVLPIVGPGGVGKTTFTQHIFEEVKSCFQVRIWICVSLNFTADRLAQEILEQIPKDNSESKNSSKEELIEQRLRSKRFLLVLDDVWKYHDDEWKKLLAPFKKVGTEGNMVIVTTRIPGVANMVRTVDHSIEMERLGPQDIMSLFEAYVFGDQQQPWQEHYELHDVGLKIVKNLKGSPLAAKTVGRLLRNQLTRDHWTRVSESKEWESQVSDNDIMPALKLSYDYLPFHLQQCLSCCALFPEDYEFHAEELVHLWIGLGILHSDDQKKRIEDVGLCYLTDLVNQGFFKKNVSSFGSPCYTIHDLLLELVVKVSSYECLSISSSNVMSIQIPPSVRHLSIIVDDADVKDKVTFEDYKRGLRALEKRFEVQNLQTLMLFGEYHANFSRVFRGLFFEARALRTVFFSGASYNVEDVLPNFPKLVHLRYLRIKSSAGFYDDKSLCVPSVLCRLYHLEVIDLLGWKGRFGSTRYMSNLVKLRHFVVPREELHSDIFEVGKLNFINELRAFRVRKESEVFELSQLGKLGNIGGLLGIYNLEKVQSEEEATESKLIQKSHMQELILGWDVHRSNRNPTFEENVLENLVPHRNLQCLRIRGHGGTNCPRWLSSNLSVKNLESLSLDDLSWGNLPPLGEMWMVNGLGLEYQNCNLGQRFQNLKRLELVKIPRLRKWVWDNTSHLFSQLEELTIKDCSELTELRSSHHSCDQPQQEKSMAWFCRLRSLRIKDCPKLLSFPPIPWTSGPCSAVIEQVGNGLEKLVYIEENGSESTYSLEVEGKDGQDCVFLNKLVFSNLTYLKKLVMRNCSPLPLDRLLMLTSLEFLQISGSSNVLSLVESLSHVRCQLPVKKISVERCGCNGKELTQLLSLVPELTQMKIVGCEEIKWLGVAEQSSTSSSAAAAEKLYHGQIGQQQRESKGGVDGVLLLTPQLQKLTIEGFPELSLLSYSLEGDREGGGLQGLRSLQSLKIRNCPMLLHSYSISSIPFLTSLQELMLMDCGEFRGEGIGPLLAQCHLTKLSIFKTPNFFAGSEPLDKELLPRSSAHQELDLRTDDIAGFLAAHRCSLLSSSLTTLTIGSNEDAERFTHEQAEALVLLTSLHTLVFIYCEKLQCLPAGLNRLASLETLQIVECQVIRSLPEDGLPSSLQKLDISRCPAIKSLPKGSLPSSPQLLVIYKCPALMSLPKNGLPSSLQNLVIWDCPALKSLPEDGLPRSLQELQIAGCAAINSLPKGGLPRSLQVLDVGYCDNEELKRQCRKLRGTIPKMLI